MFDDRVGIIKFDFKWKKSTNQLAFKNCLEIRTIWKIVQVIFIADKNRSFNLWPTSKNFWKMNISSFQPSSSKKYHLKRNCIPLFFLTIEVQLILVTQPFVPFNTSKIRCKEAWKWIWRQVDFLVSLNDTNNKKDYSKTKVLEMFIPLSRMFF